MRHNISEFLKENTDLCHPKTYGRNVEIHAHIFYAYHFAPKELMCTTIVLIEIANRRIYIK